MARVRVNFMEVLLREFLIGKTIYINVGGSEVSLVVRELNYLPDLNTIMVCDNVDPDHVDANKYKLSLKDNFDMEYSEDIKKLTTQQKIKGIQSKN